MLTLICCKTFVVLELVSALTEDPQVQNSWMVRSGYVRCDSGVTVISGDWHDHFHLRAHIMLPPDIHKYDTPQGLIKNDKYSGPPGGAFVFKTEPEDFSIVVTQGPVTIFGLDKNEAGGIFPGGSQ